MNVIGANGGSWNCKNRTNEFFAIVESTRARQGTQPANHALPTRPSRTQFMNMAAGIGREINTVATKLQKLTQLVKKKSLFDDRPVEIQELTYIINQDINALNHKIADLQHSIGMHKTAGGKQLGEHSNSVLVSLQSKLAKASTNFKNVLEIRTQNMKVQKDRRDQYSVHPPPSPSAKHSSSSILYRSRGEPQKEDSVAIDMSGAGQRQQQQLQLINQQDTYLETRSEEIRNIESTIVQLGDIFKQLGELVEQQGEQVLRIDQNVDDVESNVMEAQNQLLKYLHSFGDNRWLMIKIFIVLIIFFIIFVVFFA